MSSLLDCSVQCLVDNNRIRIREFESSGIRIDRRGEFVLVIDEDQGKSASSAKTRPGFARLIAAVAQSQVGIVIALEVTRLSR